MEVDDQHDDLPNLNMGIFQFAMLNNQMVLYLHLR